MKISKERINYVADYIIGDAHDGFPLAVALYHAECSFEEFKRLKKKKKIKRAMREADLILYAIWIQKQIENSEKSSKEINNDLFIRMLDDHVNKNILGIDKGNEEQKITISVID